MIFAPWMVRLARELAAERSTRIRSQERAEVAAHLHDSVLQTLALVQRRADDPREVATLARRQERELRAWLAGRSPGAAGTHLSAALEAVADEVEQVHGVPVEVVAVGDAPLDVTGEALVAAAREAMVNAAKFGGGGPVAVYAEAGDEVLQVFVRDRGPGFDPAAVPADRRGVRESIVGRMARHGGRAQVHATPGAGHRGRARPAQEGAMSTPRVVIVDDHRLFRAGVRAELEGRVEIVGDAETVEQAVALVLAEQPDVVLLDVHMPDGGGAEVIRGVTAAGSDARFLALSVSDAAEDVIATIRAGARGYVTKSIAPDELADAVRRVHEGDAVFSPRLAGFVLDAFAGARAGGQDGRRRRARPAHGPRAGGAAPPRPRLHVQGDRPPPRDLGQDRRGPRLLGPAQAPALEPPRAVALGGRAPARGLARTCADASRTRARIPSSPSCSPRSWSPTAARSRSA